MPDRINSARFEAVGALAAVLGGVKGGAPGGRVRAVRAARRGNPAITACAGAIHPQRDQRNVGGRVVRLDVHHHVPVGPIVQRAGAHRYQFREGIVGVHGDGVALAVLNPFALVEEIIAYFARGEGAVVERHLVNAAGEPVHIAADPERVRVLAHVVDQAGVYGLVQPPIDVEL